MAPPHDRPTMAELVEAVREFLERDVMTGTEGRLQFHARVAVNALKMVERELVDGATHAEAHAERLARLGYPDDATLAAAIHAGTEDARLQEIIDTLAESVRDKVLVANPKYLDG